MFLYLNGFQNRTVFLKRRWFLLSENKLIDPDPIDIPEEEQKKEEIQEKKLSHALDRYIIFSFACIIIYTIVSIILVIHTGMTMDTLTTCVFACFGGEILACAMIKKFKLKEKNNGGGIG